MQICSNNSPDWKGKVIVEYRFNILAFVFALPFPPFTFFSKNIDRSIYVLSTMVMLHSCVPTKHCSATPLQWWELFFDSMWHLGRHFLCLLQFTDWDCEVTTFKNTFMVHTLKKSDRKSMLLVTTLLLTILSRRMKTLKIWRFIKSIIRNNLQYCQEKHRQKQAFTCTLIIQSCTSFYFDT